MASPITWQQDSDNPDNAQNLSLIGQWWEKLDSQEVSWQQRILPSNGDIDELDWSSQRFDEKISLQKPQMRGITLYWYSPSFKDERSTTPRQLTLDMTKGDLYIYPQSQTQLVIRINKPQIVFQTVEVNDPLIVGNSVGDNYVLLLRDKQQQLQVKITLTPHSLQQLLASLPQNP
ncbi:hypothetical protein [Gloeothece verrucosa]|uniref:Uncharacterized protein n=1 Tax=Gloeothece verrucosa (strain PCC 7822) TaxID=497965 RepID=E0UFA0_GLOV7|nr:hypothetical protein [Gloeothece verrucosa]ADN15471.1 conserved hypothetical protein [Gloeothece verrucosa PCC 7822]